MTEAGQPETEEAIDWEELFRQQIPHSLRLAVRLTGNLQDAEDIVQEALLRAARGRESFRGESSFGTWTSRIVINVFRSWVSRQRTVESLDADHGSSCARPDDSLEANERAELVAACVSQLPARQKEVLVLSFYEDLPATEVAEVLGLSIQNVYSTLHVAKQQLKESMSLLMKDGSLR